jgi:hypothetical protein
MVQHPLADRDAAPAAVTVGTTTYPVTDGAVGCPDAEREHVARVLADAYDCDPAALLAADTCPVEKTDGEVCGRERPCRYHDE